MRSSSSSMSSSTNKNDDVEEDKKMKMEEDSKFHIGVVSGRRFRSAKRRCVYELGDIIGFGSAAKVFRCWEVKEEMKEKKSGEREMNNEREEGRGEIKEENEVFAAKAIDLKSLYLRADAERKRAILQREVEILQRLRHPRIVNLIDVVNTGGEMFIVMDYMKRGELFSRIVEGGMISEAQICYILLQIVLAVEYMHSEGVIHRDLKPENILLEDEIQPGFFSIKITDFGLSKCVGENLAAATTFVGTPQYWAPEVIRASKTGEEYGKEADWWSVGVILYVMIGGAYPFDSRLGAIDYLIQNGLFHFRWPRFKRASENVKDLIRGLLTVDVNGRFGVAEILNNSWVKEFVSEEQLKELKEIINSRKKLMIPSLNHAVKDMVVDEKMGTKELMPPLPVMNEMGVLQNIENLKIMGVGSGSGGDDKYSSNFSRSNSGDEIKFDLKRLLDSQLCITSRIQMALLAFRNDENSQRWIRSCLIDCFKMQGKSMNIIRKFEQTCYSVLSILPDLSLAVSENLPELALQFLGSIREWVAQMRLDANVMQNGYLDLVGKVSNLLMKIQNRKKEIIIQLASTAKDSILHVRKDVEKSKQIKNLPSIIHCSSSSTPSSSAEASAAAASPYSFTPLVLDLTDEAPAVLSLTDKVADEPPRFQVSSCEESKGGDEAAAIAANSSLVKNTFVTNVHMMATATNLENAPNFNVLREELMRRLEVLVAETLPLRSSQEEEKTTFSRVEEGGQGNSSTGITDENSGRGGEGEGNEMREDGKTGLSHEQLVSDLLDFVFVSPDISIFSSINSSRKTTRDEEEMRENGDDSSINEAINFLSPIGGSEYCSSLSSENSKQPDIEIPRDHRQLHKFDDKEEEEERGGGGERDTDMMTSQLEMISSFPNIGGVSDDKKEQTENNDFSSPSSTHSSIMNDGPFISGMDEAACLDEKNIHIIWSKSPSFASSSSSVSHLISPPLFAECSSSLSTNNVEGRDMEMSLSDVGSTSSSSLSTASSCSSSASSHLSDSETPLTSTTATKREMDILASCTASAKVLLKALEELRRVDAIVRCSERFCGNIDCTIERISQMKDHLERLINHCHHPTFRTRLEERLVTYRKFWESLKCRCCEYVEEMEKVSVKMEKFSLHLFNTADHIDTFRLFNGIIYRKERVERKGDIH